MKNMASVTGWFFLAAVLAVPSFLFYDWWARNKETAAQERAQTANTGAIFPAAEKTAFPASPGAGTASFPAGAGRVSGVFPQSESPEAAEGRQGGEVPAAPVPQIPGILKSSDAAVPSAVSAVVALSSAPVSGKLPRHSYFVTKVPRDPTMSTMEYRQIQEEKERRAEAERQRLADQKKRVKEKGVEYKMQLQGIVEDYVIINGERYTVGQTVLGAKIVKIGSDYFIGEHNGRQFRKVLR